MGIRSHGPKLFTAVTALAEKYVPPFDGVISGTERYRTRITFLTFS
jgi:hypothetical protein